MFGLEGELLNRARWGSGWGPNNCCILVLLGVASRLHPLSIRNLWVSYCYSVGFCFAALSSSNTAQQTFSLTVSAYAGALRKKPRF